MNKIIDFKKKLQNNNDTTNINTSTITITNKAPTTTSVVKALVPVATSPKKVNNKNNSNQIDPSNNVNRKKVTKSTPSSLSNNGSTQSGGGAPLLLQSMFNKGKRSNDVTNNQKLVHPLSSDLFTQNKYNNNNNNNTNNAKPILNNIPINTIDTSSSISKKPILPHATSYTTISPSNRVRENIRQLKENSKNEYKTKVCEIEKRVLNNNTNDINRINNSNFQTIQKIIFVEKEMINVFDSMIELQNSQSTTYEQILKTSSKLNNNRFFN